MKQQKWEEEDEEKAVMQHTMFQLLYSTNEKEKRSLLKPT